MKNHRLCLFSLLALACLCLYACSLTEYAPRDFPNVKLSLDVDTEAKVIVNTNRELVIHDSEGAVIQITHLDRMQNDDKTIGKLVLTTAQEQGLSLTSLKVARLDARGISGVYVEGTKDETLVLIGGFVGLLSVDGYLAVLQFPKGSSENAEHTMRSISYRRK